MEEHQFLLLLIADFLTDGQISWLLTDAIQHSQMPSSTPSPPVCSIGLFHMTLLWKDVLSLVHLSPHPMLDTISGGACSPLAKGCATSYL